MPSTPQTPKRSSARPDEIGLGYVSGVFGVRGELRLFLSNRDSDFLSPTPREVSLISPEGERRTVVLAARPGAGGRVLGRIDGVEDREGARALLGWEIVVPRAELPPTDEGEYYHFQLLGLEVVDDSGRRVGELAEIYDGEVDIWVVRGPGGPHYLPALKERVRVELDRGRIVVLASDAGEE
jgi:16S rRNA processing protein RimM